MLTDIDNNVAYQETLLSQQMRQSVERDIKAWTSALPELIAEENRLKDALNDLCGESGHDFGVEHLEDERAGTTMVNIGGGHQNYDGEGNDLPDNYREEYAYKKVMVKTCKCCGFRSVRDAKLKVTEKYI